jgi:hypothetical protein
VATPWLQVYGRHAWHGARGEAQSAPRLHSFVCQGSSLAQDDRFCDTSLSTQRRAKHKMVAGCYAGCYVPQPCMNSLLPIGPRWARRRQTRPARERRVRLRECTAHSAQAKCQSQRKAKEQQRRTRRENDKDPPKAHHPIEAVSDPPSATDYQYTSSDCVKLKAWPAECRST